MEVFGNFEVFKETENYAVIAFLSSGVPRTIDTFQELFDLGYRVVSEYHYTEQSGVLQREVKGLLCEKMAKENGAAAY